MLGTLSSAAAEAVSPASTRTRVETPVDITGPHPDLLVEATRIAGAAHESGTNICIAGGVGIALCSPSARIAPLAREYADIDIVGRSKQRTAITAVFEQLGYEADKSFNLLQGATRLLFWDTTNRRQVDVFLDRLEMCHRIELADRLELGHEALPLADLLLLKLQVVETNRKDLVDAAALLADHPFTDDESGINLPYLTRLASSDWGLWKTTTMIAERVREFVQTLEGLPEEGRRTVHDRVAEYTDAVGLAEKSRAWRLRARVGERKRWYQLPEEVR